MDYLTPTRAAQPVNSTVRRIKRINGVKNINRHPLKIFLEKLGVLFIKYKVFRNIKIIPYIIYLFN